MKKVLVTGANGYIAKHIIIELLKKKYIVKGSVRDLIYSNKIEADLEQHLGNKVNIEFCQASLDSDEGWLDAADGCDIILHTASPFPSKAPKADSDLIIPAKEGTIRILNAALNKSIHRVIITSSNAAVYDGNRHIFKFNEEIWTDVNANGVSAYTKSKTLAEKAAWEFVSNNSLVKLTTINPVLVWGPGIGNHLSSASLNIYKMIMKREMPMIPRMKVPLVDVRDVAKAHIEAIENNESIGKRFLLCENTYWMKDISLKMKSLGYNAPTTVAPDFLIKFLALFDSTLKEAVTKLGYDYNIDTKQAEEILKFNPVSLEDTLKDTYDYLNTLLK
tara:strand:+ start:2127 stop:3125 length:999 start_codon:yes stop_codon:yes gene_type:complete